jgi:hypothetical protein
MIVRANAMCWLTTQPEGLVQESLGHRPRLLIEYRALAR